MPVLFTSCLLSECLHWPDLKQVSLVISGVPGAGLPATAGAHGEHLHAVRGDGRRRVPARRAGAAAAPAGQEQGRVRFRGRQRRDHRRANYAASSSRQARVVQRWHGIMAIRQLDQRMQCRGSTFAGAWDICCSPDSKLQSICSWLGSKDLASPSVQNVDLWFSTFLYCVTTAVVITQWAALAGALEDSMESFMLSETAKYLFLLAANATGLPSFFVLSTEVRCALFYCCRVSIGTRARRPR